MDEVWETMNKELEDSIRTAELAVAKIKKLKTKDPKFIGDFREKCNTYKSILGGKQEGAHNHLEQHDIRSMGPPAPRTHPGGRPQQPKKQSQLGPLFNKLVTEARDKEMHP